MNVIVEDALALYRECFTVYGNEPEIIIKHAYEHGDIRLYRENGRAVNMICTSRITDGELDAEYIFAVCTKPEYRKRGIFTKHLDAVIGNKACILIPENESLFDFYERFGFSAIYALEAEIEGNKELPETDITAEEIYGIYKNCFQFPKKPKELFIASVNAHLEYGGKIFTDGKSAVLTYENGITDIYAPTEEDAVSVSKKVFDGKAKAIFPLGCENILNNYKFKYVKKKTAMVKNIKMPNLYINTLFN